MPRTGRGSLKAHPDFSRLPLTCELPLKLPPHCYGFCSAATAGESTEICPVELVLTPMQRILPLAGLTAGLALIPRTSAYAEEPPSDPIRSIARLQTPYQTSLQANRLSAHAETNLLLPLQRSLLARNRRNNPSPSLRHNRQTHRQQCPQKAQSDRPPGNPGAQNPPLRPRLRRPRRRRPEHRYGPLHGRRAQLHLHDRLAGPTERIQ